jgi:hypothetical protein
MLPHRRLADAELVGPAAIEPAATWVFTTSNGRKKPHRNFSRLGSCAEREPFAGSADP